MTTLIATSVVRGSHQGESHGGVYLIDLDKKEVTQPIDWNTTDIDWQGRGWDRGLRGISFDNDKVYIAASDELFVYTSSFDRINSFRNPYLKHCHEIFRYERRLFITSTGYDAILGFDLDAERFSWGLHIVREKTGFRGVPFDPNSQQGPMPGNNLHINNVFCIDKGMYISGLNTDGLLQFGGRQITRWVSLPTGIHNAQPFRDGVLFNDTRADAVRFESPDIRCAFAVPHYKEELLTHTDMDDSRVARQAFGRGLCVIGDGIIAAGSSPSTISLYDIDKQKPIKHITLSYDVRNAIHGLEVFPYS